MCSANPAGERRRRRKTAAATLAVVLAAATAGLAGPWTRPAAASALNERIVHDPYTGLALGGYDPVAYFTDGAAVRGRGIEVVWDGGYWRFANPGNAAAFAAAPTVYAPLFGGHCAASLARGALQPGDPEIFLIHRSRLLFFARAADRDAFLADPDGQLGRAFERWPTLSAVLAR
ncbi:YHS domain-containing (seleno)protein [Chthonobacter rhizosphaerae]|uniref:YHS domain-containing (seleno)protein n=1 Tax=Chthonobacter rhizosphaerae TaxID=2735553 RepID=UPI001FEA86D2|nr:YHS domain-containing (seleno)protein [Chthonobacter rhizosphaerae]